MTKLHKKNACMAFIGEIESGYNNSNKCLTRNNSHISVDHETNIEE